MFYQNVLIVKGTDFVPDDPVRDQLLKIGYQPHQLFTCLAPAYQKDDTADYEVVLVVNPNMGCPPNLVQKLNVDFPDVPLILLASVVSSDEVLPHGLDDWLLQSWLEPLLLKKTILLAIERKKNSYNYMRIFRENPSPMYIYEKESFRFLEVNTAALQQYGYSKSEFLQMNAKDIRPDIELEAFYKINKELPPTYSNAGIWQHIRKNGDHFYVHVFTHEILFAGQSCKLVMAIDIDASVKTENALKKKAREIENILESITDGFFTVNKDWEFTYINKEFERIIKRKRTELLGKNIWKAFPDTTELDFFTQYHKAMDENISVHFEEYYPAISCWLLVNAYPTDSGMAIYFIDNTTQKKYQQKIESQNKQFKEIAWVQAHQIRGPVSNLLGLVDLFNIQQPNDPDNLELLARVKHTAIQMDESIQEIVYLTRKIES